MCGRNWKRDDNCHGEPVEPSPFSPPQSVLLITFFRLQTLFHFFIKYVKQSINGFNFDALFGALSDVSIWSKNSLLAIFDFHLLYF